MIHNPPARAKKAQAFVEVSDALRSPVTRKLLDYWHSVRGAKARPRLRDFDMMALYEIAPFVTIRDAVDGGADFRCRFWGTRLREFFNVEATGKLLSETYNARSADALRSRIQLAMESEKPVRVVAVVELVETHYPKTYEAVWLPLNNDAGEPAHAVAVFDIDYEMTPEEAEHNCGPENWIRHCYPSKQNGVP